MHRTVWIFVAFVMLGGTAKAEDALSITSGVTRWSGDFGSGVDTDITAAILNASYKLPGVTLQVAAPWMRIDGPSAAFVGLNATPLFVAPNPGSTRRREGLGDLTFGATVPLIAPSDSGLAVDFTGRLKAPTSTRSSGLSTGKTDYALGLSASKPVGQVIPSFSVSYRAFGDSDDWKLKDGLASSITVAIPLPSRVTAVASYDYSKAASAFIADSHEIVMGLSAPISATRLRVTGFVAKGLSDGAADISAGVSLGLDL